MRRCFVLFLVVLSPILVFGQGKPYTQLYVFGDSYSDSGAGYVDGNGPTAVVYLAQRLNIPFTYFGDSKTKSEHPIREGLNFSVSGARTGESEGRRYSHNELLGRGMRNQVNDFAAMVKDGNVTFDPKTTMFFLLGGLNDRSLKDGETVANLEGEIETLYSLGARRFEVALLPTKIPAFASAGERFNPQLAAIPGDEQARHKDIQISNSHWGGFFDEVITHPDKYGFTNVTDKCAGRALRDEDTTPCATPATYFFYHDGHPSTAAHKAVGDLLYDEATRK
ncbi:SGNH/GDSL hydrolase family protein [Terriglobus roseus]|uniref:Phospholipase/lecithinase/hemolysin n=1 Tax=Terriglobus roseus TaxID=392734 RepID=A0A1H4NEL1_9BACT|nr:SGNH/GDSL hydrolase family protein [Terriglobus roseus]SEB93666.1 Phospholipase/lecithinase/hemolysin [Terriglobus roseus]